MDVQSILKNLHPLEIRVLRAFKPGDELTAETLERDLEYKPGHANQAFSWLGGKELVAETRREARTFFELTDLGRQTADKGTPEERIAALLRDKGAHTLPEITAALGLEQRDVGSAFGKLSKSGAIAMDADKKASFVKETPEITATAALLKLATRNTHRRNPFCDESAIMKGLPKRAADALFRIVERETVYYTHRRFCGRGLDAAGITGDEIGSITPDLLKSGSWKTGTFRGYNIAVPPARIVPGRTNPYVSFLESVKDKLCSLGFEEFDGPLVETEFWNSDALFMPQFHAARDIHDVYYVKEPTKAKSIEEPFLSNVAAAHETGGNTGSRGWNYTFDREFTKRLILRSQGTVLSAHQLATAKVPGNTSALHAASGRWGRRHPSFRLHQTEGCPGDEVNLKTLRLSEMFAGDRRSHRCKYVPGYSPLPNLH